MIDGHNWSTTEHYFQAQKFNLPGEDYQSYFAEVRDAENPLKAKKLGGKKSKMKCRADWEAVKMGIMYDCVLQKFKQNESLRQMLLSTGKAALIENSPWDSFWGCGKKKDGLNHLGRILERVRDALKEDTTLEDSNIPRKRTLKELSKDKLEKNLSPEEESKD